MESNKYFTPEIEDIFVGYECEILKEEWEFFTFNVEEIIPVFAKINNKTIISDKIRTLYLTTEQIEAEGWEHIASYRDGGTRIFSYNNKKYTYEITFRGRTHLTPSDKIVITEIRETVDRPVRVNIFNGECKDINTLRKLIKLLGI